MWFDLSIMKCRCGHLSYFCESLKGHSFAAKSLKFANAG